MNYIEQMREILMQNGLYVFPGEEEMDLEIDSLRFISIIVQIEEEFGIVIGDEYMLLTYKSLSDFADLAEKVFRE